MGYYALKWGKRSTFDEIGENRLLAMSRKPLDLAQYLHFRQRSDAGRLEKKKSGLMLHNSG